MKKKLYSLATIGLLATAPLSIYAESSISTGTSLDASAKAKLKTQPNGAAVMNKAMGKAGGSTRAAAGTVGAAVRGNTSADTRMGAGFEDETTGSATGSTGVKAGVNTGANAEVGTGIGLGTGVGVGAGMGVGTNPSGNTGVGARLGGGLSN